MALSLHGKYEGLNAAYKVVSTALRFGRWTSFLRGPLLELQRAVSKARYDVESRIGLTRLSVSAANREFTSLLNDFYSGLLVFQSTLKYGSKMLENGEEAGFHLKGLDQIEKSATELKAIRDRIYLITPRFGFDTHVTQLMLNYELGTYCKNVNADMAALYLDNSQRIYRTYYFWGFSPQESLRFLRRESEVKKIVGENIPGVHVVEWMPLFNDLYHGIKLYLFRKSSDFSEAEKKSMTSDVFFKEGDKGEQFYIPVLDYLTMQFRDTALKMLRARHSSGIDEADHSLIPGALKLRKNFEQHAYDNDFLENQRSVLKSLLADLPASIGKTRTWVEIYGGRGQKTVKADVVPLIRKIAYEFGGKVKERGLKLILDVNVDKAVCHFCRAPLIDTVNNLVENAIKYNSVDGTIVLKVFTKEKVRNDGVAVKTINISVADTGIGIPADEQKKVFDGSYRASNVGKVSGTGTGLNEAKSWIMSMGGDIKLESKVGVGSTFTVELPLIQQ